MKERYTAGKRRNRGFTLTEMLIVTAVIAVLVIIVIPFFRKSLERSREATDLANVRVAYAEIMTTVLTADTEQPEASALPEGVVFENGSYYKVVELCQKEDRWQSRLPLRVAGVGSETTENGTDADANWVGKPRAGGTCRVEFKTAEQLSYFYWEEAPAGGDGPAETEPPQQTNPPDTPVEFNVPFTVSGISLPKQGANNHFSIEAPTGMQIKIIVSTGGHGNGNTGKADPQEFTLEEGINYITVAGAVPNGSINTISIVSVNNGTDVPITQAQFDAMIASMTSLD